MRIFLNIPVELENIIWIYTGLFKLRNGILISQIKNTPLKIVERFNNLNYNMNHTLTNVIYLFYFKHIKNKNTDESYMFQIIIYPNKIMYLLSVSNSNKFDSIKYISQSTLR
jgi:hypothetical protein